MISAVSAPRFLDLKRLNLMRWWMVGGLALCAAPSVCADDTQSSLALDVQPIFDSYCVQCHMLEAPQGDLVLEEGEAHGQLVGVKSTQSAWLRVSPGAPQESYLLNKLRGSHAVAGGFGSGMPLSEGFHRPLPERDIQRIEAWIRGGADDN